MNESLMLNYRLYSNLSRIKFTVNTAINFNFCLVKNEESKMWNDKLKT